MNKSFQTIDNFFLLRESKEWPDNNTQKKEIKNAFKISIYVEQIVQEVKKHRVYKEFCLSYNRHLILNKMDKQYKMSELENACDCIINKFVSSTNLNVEIVDYAISEFIQICGSERFQQILSNSILVAASYKTLNQSLLLMNIDNGDLELDMNYFLSYWLHKYNVGRSDEVTEEINIIFQTFEKQNLKLFLKMLIQTENDEDSMNFILDILINAFLNKINENKNLWSCLLKFPAEMTAVCLAHPKILLNVCQFVFDYEQECAVSGINSYDITKDQYDKFIAEFSQNSTCLKKLEELKNMSNRNIN